MALLYSIDFQLANDDWNLSSMCVLLKPYLRPVVEQDEDWRSSTSFRLIFRSSMLPGEMKLNLANALKQYSDSFVYADVLYRWPEEIFHDRFVVWNDGTAQEYTTKDVYIEDGERTEVKA